MLFLTYGLFCGVGTGIVYVGVVGLMARWFPDRRGFAIGVVAAGYGMGAMLTTFPISAMLAASGAPMTLVVFGVILGGVWLTRYRQERLRRFTPAGFAPWRRR